MGLEAIISSATSKGDRGKWDDEQEWLVANSSELDRLGFGKNVKVANPVSGKTHVVSKVKGGWEPYAHFGGGPMFRKRIK